MQANFNPLQVGHVTNIRLHNRVKINTNAVYIVNWQTKPYEVLSSVLVYLKQI